MNRTRVVLEHEGRKCIYPDFDSAMEDLRIFFENEAEKVTVTFTKMTDAQCDALEEFQGW